MRTELGVTETLDHPPAGRPEPTDAAKPSRPAGAVADRRPDRIPYLPGLDGLRAIAVLAVLGYHADLTVGPTQLFSGGFLGVEVFFVISGYLITSILLTGWRREHRLDLVSFYRKRARRLLPALFATLLAVVVLAVLFLPDEVAGLRGDVVASLAYVTNWFFILGDKPYFEVVGRPSLLQHLWSLAVEEQFYIVWPVLFAGGMKVLGRRRLGWAVLAGAVASAAWMAWLAGRGAGVTRLYEGTDTRAAGILLGAALSFVWAPQRLRADITSGAKVLLDGVGLVACGILLVLFMVTSQFADALYRFGFFGIAALTSVVIAVLVHPAAHLGRALGLGPLRWVGLRSYGIYLYHWPVFQLTRPQLDVPIAGLPLLALRLAVTFALAELSYRFLETPIRVHGFGRVRRAAGDAFAWWHRTLGLPGPTAGIATAVVAALLVGAVVRAEPPEVPSYLKVGATASGPPPVRSSTSVGDSTVTAATAMTVAPDPIETTAPPASDPAAPDPETTVAAAAEPVPPPTTAPLPPPAPPTTRRPVPVPLATIPPADRVVTALGDSVMLGAAPALTGGTVPGQVFVDAAVGRQVGECLDILRSWRDEGRLGDIVVVHIGNNGTFRPSQFDELRDILSGVLRVIVVNVKVPRSWEGYNNDVIAEGMTRFPNAELVDWKAQSDPYPELFWDDGMHLRPDGAALYARLAAGAM